jgi:hypothetical protein
MHAILFAVLLELGERVLLFHFHLEHIYNNNTYAQRHARQYKQRSRLKFETATYNDMLVIRSKYRQHVYQM